MGKLVFMRGAPRQMSGGLKEDVRHQTARLALETFREGAPISNNKTSLGTISSTQYPYVVKRSVD